MRLSSYDNFEPFVQQLAVPVHTYEQYMTLRLSKSRYLEYLIEFIYMFLQVPILLVEL